MFVALFTVLSLFLFRYVLPTEVFNDAVVGPTRGLVNATLIFTVLETCFLLVFVRVAGGLRPRDLGLASSLPRALLFTALLWVLTQISIAFWQLGTAGQLSWHDSWRESGTTFVLGEFVTQLFGNALYEEAVFRGFLFVQLILLFRKWEVGHALLKSLFISQSFFALLHISFQLFTWRLTWFELDQFLSTLIVGIVLAVVYAKTGNLFIAVGFHVLFNGFAQLFTPPEQETVFTTSFVSLIITASLGLALVFWPVTGRLWQDSPQPPRKSILTQR